MEVRRLAGASKSHIAVNVSPSQSSCASLVMAGHLFLVDRVMVINTIVTVGRCAKHSRYHHHHRQTGAVGNLRRGRPRALVSCCRSHLPR